MRIGLWSNLYLESVIMTILGHLTLHSSFASTWSNLSWKLWGNPHTSYILATRKLRFVKIDPLSRSILIGFEKTSEVSCLLFRSPWKYDVIICQKRRDSWGQGRYPNPMDHSLLQRSDKHKWERAWTHKINNYGDRESSCLRPLCGLNSLSWLPFTITEKDII